MTYGQILGELLRELRRRRGVTQQQLAAHVGWGDSKISRVEAGVLPLDVDQLRELAAALESTAAELLELADAVAAYLEEQGVKIRTGRRRVRAPASLALLVAEHLESR